VTRLLDMGIPPFLVAGAVGLVLAQRLVRVLCPRCSRSGGESIDVLRAAGWCGPPFVARRHAGCSECAGSGYRGRVAVYEAMVADDRVREAIVAGATARELRRIACEAGMRTLRQSALAVAARGTTTLEEVLRVTPAE